MIFTGLSKEEAIALLQKVVNEVSCTFSVTVLRLHVFYFVRSYQIQNKVLNDPSNETFLAIC